MIGWIGENSLLLGDMYMAFYMYSKTHLHSEQSTEPLRAFFLILH